MPDHDVIGAIFLGWIAIAILLVAAIHRARTNLRKRRDRRALQHDPFFNKIEEFRNGIS